MLIGQISDFHVTAAGKQTASQALAHAVKTINALSPQPDVVIGSGDLTQNGLDQEYAILREILHALKAPFLPVMGNHDRRNAFRRAFADMEAAFSPGEFVQYCKLLSNVKLIVLDTVCAGSEHGAYCEERFAWLTQALNSDLPVILVMHHPPFLSGIDWVDSGNAAEWSWRMAKALNDAPRVIRILCGHVHRAIHGTWCGIPVSTAPSTSLQIALNLSPGAKAEYSSEPAGFQLHCWNGRDLLTHSASVEGFFERFPLDTSAGETTRNSRTGA